MNREGDVGRPAWKRGGIGIEGPVERPTRPPAKPASEGRSGQLTVEEEQAWRAVWTESVERMRQPGFAAESLARIHGIAKGRLAALSRVPADGRDR